jgi:ubiquinone biosynthesis protein COQ4
MLDNIRRAKELYAADKGGHIADIAILKADALGMRPFAHVAAALEGFDTSPSALDVGAMAELPRGTFGRQLADFLGDNGLSPFVLTDEIDDEMRVRNAYWIRYATTHDMFHVLLGFGPDWPGELGVLGFAVGQRYGWYLWFALALAVVVYPVLSGLRLSALWRQFWRGYRAGRRAPLLLAVPLEQMVERDLDELRVELHLAA